MSASNNPGGYRFLTSISKSHELTATFDNHTPIVIRNCSKVIYPSLSVAGRRLGGYRLRISLHGCVWRFARRLADTEASSSRLFAGVRKLRSNEFNAPRLMTNLIDKKVRVEEGFDKNTRQ